MIYVLLAQRREEPLEYDRINAIADAVIQGGANSILAARGAIDEQFAVTAERLLARPGKILVTGSGTSGAIASRGAHLLSVCGAPAFHLSPSEGIHGGLGVLRAEDSVLALSKGGKSEELNDFCRRARTLCGHLVVITADANSPFAQLADDVIHLPLAPDGDLGGVVATGSSLAMGAILDALAEIGRVRSGYSWKELLYTHPAGVVGHQADESLARLAPDGKATP
ncbi:MAG: SIS domain-containing protein [Paracoccaceae bacterium]